MVENLLFPVSFQIALQALVNVHHSIYPMIPPQGIYFEALVEEAFRKVKKPFTLIGGTRRNQPTHDLFVEDCRISLKTETGTGTKEKRISITKLCTTEKEPWTAEVLRERALEHLSRYDVILMLRAVWVVPLIHYQLVEIPVPVLRRLETASLDFVGKRKGRQSIGADVFDGSQLLFHVHFDGSDGKCQIRNFDIAHCVMLNEWDLHVRS